MQKTIELREAKEKNASLEAEVAELRGRLGAENPKRNEIAVKVHVSSAMQRLTQANDMLDDLDYTVPIDDDDDSDNFRGSGLFFYRSHSHASNPHFGRHL